MGCFMNSIMGDLGIFSREEFRLTFLVKCDIIKELTIGLSYGTLTYYSINLVVFALSI